MNGSCIVMMVVGRGIVPSCPGAQLRFALDRNPHAAGAKPPIALPDFHQPHFHHMWVLSRMEQLP